MKAQVSIPGNCGKIPTPRTARSQKSVWWPLAVSAALAPMILLADDYGLGEYVGPPADPMQEALRTPDNGPEAVTVEINTQSIRKLLARSAGVTNLQKTEGIQLIVSGDETRHPTDLSPIYGQAHYNLKYPTAEAKEAFSDQFQTQIKNYLTLRLTGHTKDFAVASISRPKRSASARRRSIDVVLNAYKEIPEPWLTLWKEDGKAVGYYLVDGKLAWTFRFMGSLPWLQVADAQEFDPKLKDIFSKAQKKAQDNLTARGIERRLGYCHLYWAELKKVLREDYNISWWCPSDLNRTIYD